MSPISKKISTFLAALFKQLLDFRIYLFLKMFAKSINKLTRGDYVNWGTITELYPITEIRPNDGKHELYTHHDLSNDNTFKSI